MRGPYFRIDDRPLCEPCAERAIETPQAGRHAAFSRAILVGVAAAVAGMLLYAGIEILTGWVIGYAAIGVGYLVGKGMKMGSHGRGGRLYQIAAALLTYAAVAMAAIPVGIHASMKDPSATTREATAAPADHSDQPAAANSADGSAAKPASGSSGSGHPILRLLGMGLVSPFLELQEGAGGLIGLFILFIGIRAAWGLTAGSEFLLTGPYHSSPGGDDASPSRP